MVKSRRILSVILSVIMVLTMVPVAAITANAEPIATASSAMTNDGKLFMPTVSLKATPVLRLAAANNGTSTAIGNKLVSATPSGLPQISSTYSSQYYAGETPVAPTVVFTTDTALSEAPSIQASVGGITFTAADPVTSNGITTYTWTLSGGDTTFNRGNIDFTVTYKYSYVDSFSGHTVEKTFNAVATSYADYIAEPAGGVIYRERSAPWTTHEREHSLFDIRILGANTYSSFYTAAKASLNRGYYNYFSAGDSFSTVSGNAEGYGQVYKSRVKEGDTGTEYFLTDLDGNRPVATTYVDLNGGMPTLEAANNLRLSFFEGLNRSDYTRWVAWTRVVPGDVGYSENTANNTSAMGQIGLKEVSGDQVAGYGEAHYPFAGNTYDADTTVAANGNIVSNYTVIGCAGTKHTNADNRICYNAVGISLRINMYDKSELRFYISDLLRENDPVTSKLAASSLIGLNPQSQFYSNGFDAYNTALKAAQGVLAKPDTDQNTINAALSSLETAVAGLEVAGADFTQYNIAVERYTALEAADYTSASWNAVNTAYKAAKDSLDYSVFYQSAVDKYVDDFNTAMDNLVERSANWEKVDTAVAAYEELVAKDYTTETWTVLRNAVNAALAEYEDHGPESTDPYKKSQQAYVDSLAQAISDAIEGLKYSLADYTAFDAQVARYNGLVEDMQADMAALEDEGVDFDALGITSLFTDATQTRVENNLTVDRTITWPNQKRVDSATSALTSAINALKYRNAETSGLMAAIEAADDVNPDWWTEESYGVLADIYDEAFTNVIEAYPALSILEQATVNQYEQDILDAIDALEEAQADYSAVEDLVQYAEELDGDLYEADSYNALMDVVADVNWDYMAKDQDKVDLIETALTNAINNLVPLGADYDRVDAAIADWENNYKANASNYVNAADVTAAINNVVRGYDITKQDDVDDMAIAIENAIANLQLKGADYTNLKAEYELAKAAIQQQADYAAANDGYEYYTAATIGAVETAFAAVPAQNGVVTENKTILEQGDVDALYNTLKAAVDALALNVADYSKLIAALETVPSDDDLENLYTPETAADVVIAAMEGESAVEDKSYTVADQAAVDALTKAVNDAVAALQIKGLDLTSYNAALEAEAAKGELDQYTTATVDAMNAAKTAATNYKNDAATNKITNQAAFEELVAAYDEAIAALEIWYADYTAVNEAKTAAAAKVAAGVMADDTNIYTDESIAAVDAAIAAVVEGKLHKEQSTVDGYAAAINAAAAALTEKPLDLTAYNAAVEKETAKGDLTPYTDASVAAMNSAKNAADSFKNNQANNKISKQADFDALVAAYDAAIDALEFKGADYTAVNAAIAAANTETAKGIYTDESVAAVTAAIEAVVEGKLVNEQEIVDGYAAAINAAVAALVEKPLDLTKYNAAAALEAEKIAAANNDITNYEDALVAAMNAAKDAATAYKNDAATNKISNQTNFDYSLVKAYEDAVKALKLKKADYTELDALVAEANGLDEDLYDNYEEVYWDDGGLYDVVEGVVPSVQGLDILHQADVDQAAADLQTQLARLVLKASDYSAVDAIVAEAEALIATGNYTDDSVSALEDVIYGVYYGYTTILEQDLIDAYIPEIQAAIDALVEKPANFDEVDALVAYMEEVSDAFGYDATKDVEYTNFDDIYWDYMYDFIYDKLPTEKAKGYTVSQQAAVDALRIEFQGYIDMLKTEVEPPVVNERFELTSTAEFLEKDGVQYIVGLEQGLKRKTFESGFTDQENVYLEYSNTVNRTAVGTGTTITVKSAIDDRELGTYVIVIYGDVDGDGFCDVNDVKLAQESVSGAIAKFEDAAAIAADVTGRRAGFDEADVETIIGMVNATLNHDQIHKL